MSRRRLLLSTSYLQAMYQRLFDWVVHQVNSSVEMKDCGADSIVIGVVDIYDFPSRYSILINRWGWLTPTIGVMSLLHVSSLCHSILSSSSCDLHLFYINPGITHVHACTVVIIWYMHTCTLFSNCVCIIVFITNICSSDCCRFASTTAMNNCSSSSSSLY